MSRLRNENVLLVLIVIVFAAAFTWLIAIMNTNNDMRRDLDFERLRAESLLSERHLIEQSVVETQQLIKGVMDSLATAAEGRYGNAPLRSCSTSALQCQLATAMDRLQSAFNPEETSPMDLE